MEFNGSFWPARHDEQDLTPESFLQKLRKHLQENPLRVARLAQADLERRLAALQAAFPESAEISYGEVRDLDDPLDKIQLLSRALDICKQTIVLREVKRTTRQRTLTATDGEPAAEPKRVDPDKANRDAIAKQVPGTRPKLKYRSEMKRAILIQLTQDPDATDHQICRRLDEYGAAELPAKWRRTPQDRSFEDAYRDETRRHKIENAISKVRTDMRRAGLQVRS